jgi:hypothetical protein
MNLTDDLIFIPIPPASCSVAHRLNLKPPNTINHQIPIINLSSIVSIINQQSSITTIINIINRRQLCIIVKHHK